MDIISGSDTWRNRQREGKKTSDSRGQCNGFGRSENTRLVYDWRKCKNRRRVCCFGGGCRQTLLLWVLQGRIVRMGNQKMPRTDLDQIHLPDPVLNDIRELLKQKHSVAQRTERNGKRYAMQTT